MFAVLGIGAAFGIAAVAGILPFTFGAPFGLAAALIGVVVFSYWSAGLAAKQLTSGSFARAALLGMVVAVAWLVSAVHAASSLSDMAMRLAMVGELVHPLGWVTRPGLIPALVLGALFGLLVRWEQARSGPA